MHPLVYEELRRIAKVRLRGERAGHSLQPTMLVNDAYLQLVAQKDHDWQNRSHFFAVAAQLMRRILIDHARWVNAEKRGGGQVKLELDFDVAIPEAKVGDLLAVDQALQRLEQLDPRQCRIVELRFFGGLNEEEIAEVLGIGLRTVKRDWKMARVWLRLEMGGQR